MSYSIVHDGLSREGWLRARGLGVGASEVPILFGCGYGDSAQLDLYARKIGAELPEREADEGMDLGKELEETITRLVAKRAGVGSGYTHNKALLANEAHPHLVCTPDAITVAGEPVEIKNICHRIDESEWENGIPFKYELQLQSQIAVMEAKRGLFGAMLFGARIVWTWLDRDEALITEIQDRINDFWGHVERLDPCRPNGTRSSRQAAVAIAKSLPPKVLLDGDVEQAVVDYERCKSEEAYAKKCASAAEMKRKACEDSIILMMGSSTQAVTQSGWIFQRTVTKRKASVTKASETHGLKILAPQDERVA